MTVAERIMAAVTPVVPECEPDVYYGDAAEYCTFNADETHTLYADDKPQVIVHLVQVHWFLPLGVNPETKKRQIARSLTDLGFSSPDITNASDKDGQHYVFECEYEEGVEENII